MILDRYVLRNFLEPFLLSFFGFIAIWFVFDLKNDIGDFIEYHTKLTAIIKFYLSQLPAVLVFSIPVGLLLALLFALSKMSRHNEVISMLTAGRSLVRVLAPLMIVGVLASGVCFLLNSEAGPHAAAAKEKFDKITRGEKRAENNEIVEGHLFRDRQHFRTWYVRRLDPSTPFLDGVHITQQDANGVVLKKWYAKRAQYDAKQHKWFLIQGMSVELDPSGDVIKTEDFTDPANGVMIIDSKDWTETPWRIASSQLEADNLSISELQDYLKGNADFPSAQLAPYRVQLADRFALPLSCLVVVFIASPLGIVYNRRGVLASVASSIFIFFAMILLRYFFLAMGKGSHLDPTLAAWLPDGAFFCIGVFLLFLRSTNRDLKLAFWR